VWGGGGRGGRRGVGLSPPPPAPAYCFLRSSPPELLCPLSSRGEGGPCQIFEPPSFVSLTCLGHRLRPPSACFFPLDSDRRPSIPLRLARPRRLAPVSPRRGRRGRHTALPPPPLLHYPDCTSAPRLPLSSPIHFFALHSDHSPLSSPLPLRPARPRRLALVSPTRKLPWPPS
jgi:hypothetical protein